MKAGQAVTRNAKDQLYDPDKRHFFYLGTVRFCIAIRTV